MKTQKKKKRNIDNWVTRGVIISSILILWGAAWILLMTNFDCYTERGQFGDMFGSVNSLFSGLAFAGIIYTVLLQREELSAQRRELKLTRREFKKQNETLRIQRFENTFFNMLSMLNEIVTNMEGVFTMPNEPEKRIFKGRAYLRRALEQFHEMHFANFRYEYDETNGFFIEFNNATELLNPNATLPEPTGKTKTLQALKEIVDEEFQKFFLEQNSSLGHYFRYVYNIIKFVKATEWKANEDPIGNFSFTQLEVVKYLEILQAQLSNDELGLIFYDAISRHGKNKVGQDIFWQWLDEHGILENLVKENLLDESHVKFYPKTVFKFILQK